MVVKVKLCVCLCLELKQQLASKESECEQLRLANKDTEVHKCHLKVNRNISLY